ncbi:MAG: hypothetical protein PHP32_00750 [Candidatus Izemoplasmatales bacterium]|nr:hypothetical protein [Candidatus Izemoplasmatales bacterium]
MRKPTNRTSYREVCALYEKYGLTDYTLKTAGDVLNIHNFDLRETTGYEDLTEDQKKLFIAYAITHMNGLGMNTKITMWPKSVHFVKEYSYCSSPVWDDEEQREVRWQIGREWIIQKVNGRTKKFKKYFDEGKSEANVDSVYTTEKEYLRVDWKYNGGNEWFHVLEPTRYF